MIRFVFAAFMLWGVNASALQYKIEKITNHSGHTLNVVRMEGMIEFKEPMHWLAVTQMLDSNLDTLFVINSPGGNVPMGLMTIKRIDEYIANDSHRTWIAIDGQCTSMCVPLFFSWPNRFAVSGTEIGLHGSSDGGLGLDPDLTRAYLDDLRRHARARGEASALDWIERMVSKGEFSSPSLTMLPASEVARQNGLLGPSSMVPSVDQLIEML